MSAKEKRQFVIGAIVLLALAVLAITRPIYVPPVQHAKTTVTRGYAAGPNGTQVPIGGEQ